MALVLLGKIINTFGLKGELKIKSFTDFAHARYGQNQIVYLSNDQQKTTHPYTVESYKNVQGFDVIKLQGISSLEESEKLRGYELFANLDDLALPPTSFHYAHLLECQVYDEKDHLLGQITRIEDIGPHVNLIVKQSNGKTFAVPFVDFFILKVDLNTKKIIIHVIEGLL